MSFRTRIQSFISADVPSPLGSQCVPNFRGGLLYIYSQVGAKPVAGFVYNSGVQFKTVNLDPIFPECMAVDSIGNLYTPGGLSNYESVTQLSPQLETLQTFGTASAGENYPDGIPTPQNMTCCVSGQANFMVGCSLFAPFPNGPHLASLVVGHNFNFAGAVYVTPQGSNSSSCASKADGQNGAVYIAVGPASPSDTPQQIDIYRYNFTSSAVTYDPGTWPTENTDISVDSLGAILPTDIDATWTHIFQDGCIVDQADGKLIVKVRTTDVVTNACYLAKINPADLSVLWTVAFAHSANDSSQMSMGQTVHGSYAFLSIGGIIPHEHTCTIINTLDGTTTSYQDGLDGVTLGAQCYDEISGAVIAYVDFTAGADSPVPIGNTPSSFTGWAAIYVNGPYTAPFQNGFVRTWGRWT